MVASFPEFDYRKTGSNTGGCVPLAHRPIRLSNALQPKSSIHSTFLGKILSFHGSFSSSSRNRSETQNRTQIRGGKIGFSSSSADAHLLGGPLPCDPDKRSATSKDVSSARKMGRKWSIKSLRSNASGMRENDSGATQHGGACQYTECDPPGRSCAMEMRDHASKMGKACRSQSYDACDHKAQGCDGIEVVDYAQRTQNNCTIPGGDSPNKQGNVGVQKITHAAPVMPSSVRGSEVIQSDSAAYPCKNSRKASSHGVSNGCEDANSVHSRHREESLQKVSSSALGAVHTFISENPLYASDNSSNNMRWSSTSCASSTDTSSSNSTRHSSCEARVCVASPMLPPFLAKPHKAHDAAWVAIRSLQLQQGGAPLAITHFNLIRRVGHGDIGSVFLAHLKDVASPPHASYACLFAIKVMDKDTLLQRNKLQRMHMEKEILECVDHPFLPTLYAHFDSEHYSCLVMDFCPGGDLYALRQKQPGKRFGLIAARFYAAEVLLALEYLHMLGVVYRDLKPENVLVRDDGHIMLTDFDLSLKCDVKPEIVRHPLLSSSSLSHSSSRRTLLRSHSQSSTISSSSTMRLLHHELNDCRLPASCSIEPIISCLSLSNHTRRRGPQVLKQQSPIGLSLLNAKASNASHACASLDRRDVSISEPLQLSKQDVLGVKSTAWKTRDDVHGGGGAAMGVKMSALHSRSARRAHHDDARAVKLSKENHGRSLTSGLGCQEEDNWMCNMELVAEPTEARSMSFVGTHEYLAPEIIAGCGHGSAVDWWTFGIFLYELVYGRTPFKGASNEQTLINVVRQKLRFPETGSEIDGIEDVHSLIQGLLAKDPRGRLGSRKGAPEIKQHDFFKGVNWALIRCTRPPEVPSPSKKGLHASSNHHHHHHSKSLHQFEYF